MLVVAFFVFCLSCGSSIAAEVRCLEAPPELNATCSEGFSVRFFWSEDLHTCLNVSVCGESVSSSQETDGLFCEEDQCLKVCRDNEDTQEIPKDCIEVVRTRCSSASRYPRPIIRYSYFPQTQDCKEISIVKCPTEHLDGPNIFANITDCRLSCRVRLPTTTATTATTWKETGLESKPHPDDWVLATTRLVADTEESYSSSQLIPTLADPGGGGKAGGDYGTGKTGRDYGTGKTGGDYGNMYDATAGSSPSAPISHYTVHLLTITFFTLLTS